MEKTWRINVISEKNRGISKKRLAGFSGVPLSRCMGYFILHIIIKIFDVQITVR